MSSIPLPMQMLERMPRYMSFLKSVAENGPANISAAGLAQGLGLPVSTVKEDLARTGAEEQAHIGYLIDDLIFQIEELLGRHDVRNVAVAGMGELGKFLLGYQGFERCGLEIAAAFDWGQGLADTEVCGKRILPAEKTEDLCRRLGVHMGVIATSEEEAQAACDAFVKGGVLAVWNFTPASLQAPENVLIQNEDMEAVLASLSTHLFKQIYQ